MPSLRWLAARVGLFVALLLATSARAQDQPWAIYVMRPDGSGVRKVAQSVDHFDHGSPRWSHDGQRIAFDGTRKSDRKREFMVVNVDGTGLQVLGENSRPDWSPDDKQLVFDRYTNGLKVYVQNVDGGEPTEIASGVSGRWSPDGSQLAVTDHHQMKIVDLVTNEERNLLDVPYDNLYGGFSWSPDGKQIVFTGQTKAEGGGKRPLVLISADGQKAGMQVLMKSGQGGAVSFSPDGQRLIFDNGYLIHTLDVDGKSPPKRVPGQVGKNRDPHWSPNGAWIVFASDRP